MIGLIADISLRAESLLRNQEQVAVAQVDLIGEIRDNETASAFFQRGVSSYPAIGDAANIIGSRELRLIFQNPGSRMIEVGLPAHTAPLGMTFLEGSKVPPPWSGGGAEASGGGGAPLSIGGGGWSCACRTMGKQAKAVTAR